MKKSELKLYTPFYNQNGHLSIIYNITNNKYHIINYNGSVYTLTIDNSEVKYGESYFSIQEFFDNFPKDKLRFDTKVVYDAIVNTYSNRHNNKNSVKRRLLLIL